MSMKASDYKAVIDENGNGALYVLANGEWTFICDMGNVVGKSAKEVNELEQYYLKFHDIEISANQEVIIDRENFMVDQQADLDYIRKQMREVMKALSDKKTTLTEKKQMLSVFQTMCVSAQIMANACKLQYAMSKTDGDEMVRLIK